MIFEQRQLLIGSTHLALRAQGLYVRRRNPQGLITLELEMPFEEILPVRTEHYRRVPWALLVFTIILIVGLGIAPWRTALTTGLVSPDMLLWLFISGGTLLNLWLHYERLWSRYHLRTPHLNLALADRPWQRRQLTRFTAQLEHQAKDYLRARYGQVNPLGPIDLQVNRLQWLQEMSVLTAAEAAALTLRLTGRPTDTLQGMGQELEGPYVN